MRFILASEGDTPPGASYVNRYDELIREAILCEAMGFYAWGLSEQHFQAPNATISAPEVIYGAVSQLTRSIKIRAMSFVMLPFNHPLRVAERVATLDILTRGRFEMGTARGNNPKNIAGFQVEGSKTKQQWKESLELCVRALAEENLVFDGQFYKVDDITLTPRLYSNVLPPIFLSATSQSSHHSAGELALGVMSATPYGWDYLNDCVRTYNSAWSDTNPIGGHASPNKSVAHVVYSACCAPTQEEALEVARPSGLGFVKWLIDFYASASEMGADYEYLKEVRKTMEGHEDDLKHLSETLPWFLIGTPSDIIEQVKKFEAMGIDELILRMDGYGHRQIMDSIEMFGKYVIPEFTNPANVNRIDLYGSVGVGTNRPLI